MADKDKLATLSLNFLTHRVGIGYPPRETSPRLTKITHVHAGHTVRLMKHLSPSFTMQCSTTCTYYVWGMSGEGTHSVPLPGEVPDCGDIKNVDTRQNMPPERLAQRWGR